MDPASKHKRVDLFSGSWFLSITSFVDAVYSRQVVECAKMTVTPKISISDGNLVVHGKTILKGVPDNIILTPGSGVGLVAGAFIGATADDSKSLHVFPMGALE